MSMDLVISDKGHVLIASNAPFADEVTRVDFHSGRKLLMLHYRYAMQDGELLNCEVPDRMMSTLLKAPSLLLVHFEGGKPAEGYEVPLVQVDFSIV